MTLLLAAPKTDVTLVSFKWKPNPEFWRPPEDVRYELYTPDGSVAAFNMCPREARWRALCVARELSVKTGRRHRVKLVDWPNRPV